MERSEQVRISIIVPIHNASRTLDRCVQSLVAQTCSEIEILLIDDGSQDNSFLICNKWAQKDRRVRVFHQDNKGVSAARNMGLEKVRGEYYTFVDSDDWIHKEFCERMLCKAERTEADMVLCKFNMVDRGRVIEKDENNLDFLVHEKKAYGFLLEATNGAMGCVWRVLYHTASFQTVRFQNKLYIFEDLIYFLSCLHMSKITAVLDDHLYFYCVPEEEYHMKYYRSGHVNCCYFIGETLYNLLCDFGFRDYASAELFKTYCFTADAISHGSRDPRNDFKELKKVLADFRTIKYYQAYRKLYHPNWIRTFLIYHRMFFIYRFFYRIKFRHNIRNGVK